MLRKVIGGKHAGRSSQSPSPLSPVALMAPPASSSAAPTTVVAGSIQDAVRSKSELVAENAMLRQQLIVAGRLVKRPSLRTGDRLFMVLLDRDWRDALHLVQPDTLLRWHRDLFKILWRRKSRTSQREPRIARETIRLIRKMAGENSWGAERIRGELLSIKVSKRTIQRYMRGMRGLKKPPQTWKTFLENHAEDIWACDFIQFFSQYSRSSSSSMPAVG